MPQPGRPVRGSSTARPIMALLELLGRRWTLRVVWELRDAPLSFRDLQGACSDMSPSVLNQRLAELRDAGIVTTTADGYALSESGRELLVLMKPLSGWAERWASKLREQSLRRQSQLPRR